jgi:hypothetical protein
VKVEAGTVDFKTPSLPDDKPCQIWYSVIGNLKTSSTGRPLVTLHGGRGACHRHLLPSFSELSDKYGVPVVFYNHIGNEKSTHYREKRLASEMTTAQCGCNRDQALCSGIQNYLREAESYLL